MINCTHAQEYGHMETGYITHHILPTARLTHILILQWMLWYALGIINAFRSLFVVSYQWNKSQNTRLIAKSLQSIPSKLLNKSLSTPATANNRGSKQTHNTTFCNSNRFNKLITSVLHIHTVRVQQASKHSTQNAMMKAAAHGFCTRVTQHARMSREKLSLTSLQLNT